MLTKRNSEEGATTNVVYYITYTEGRRYPLRGSTDPNGWNLSTLVPRKLGPFDKPSQAEGKMIDLMGLPTTVPGSVELFEEEEAA